MSRHEKISTELKRFHFQNFMLSFLVTLVLIGFLTLANNSVYESTLLLSLVGFYLATSITITVIDYRRYQKYSDQIELNQTRIYVSSFNRD